MDIARQAAMRLMSQRLTPWEREELIVAAETLGLTEQAITLKSRFATSGHAHGGFAGRPMFFHAGGPGLDTIEGSATKLLVTWNGRSVVLPPSAPCLSA